MKPKRQNGRISGMARDTLAKIIDHVLRDECSLAATTRDYRWNLTGPNLYSLHRLFDEQRRQLEFWLNQVVQCAKSVGVGSRIPVEEVARAAHAAPATSGVGLPPQTMIGDLLSRHEQMAHQLRQDIGRLGNPAAADVLKHLLEFHETTAWMLRMLHDGPSSGIPA
jgi:starvation-inducible DNA-binding protein